MFPCTDSGTKSTKPRTAGPGRPPPHPEATGGSRPPTPPTPWLTGGPTRMRTVPYPQDWNWTISVEFATASVPTISKPSRTPRTSGAVTADVVEVPEPRSPDGPATRTGPSPTAPRDTRCPERTCTWVPAGSGTAGPAPQTGKAKDVVHDRVHSVARHNKSHISDSPRKVPAPKNPGPQESALRTQYIDATHLSESECGSQDPDTVKGASQRPIGQQCPNWNAWGGLGGVRGVLIMAHDRCSRLCLHSHLIYIVYLVMWILGCRPLGDGP